MTKAEVFLEAHAQSPSQIDANDALIKLAHAAKLGLEGKSGGLPMIPSYLNPDIKPPSCGVAAVLDAGGTSLRTALACFDENGHCSLGGIESGSMPGTNGEISAEELYSRMAQPLHRFGSFDRIGCCFSYLVDIEESLDGVLSSLCKELRVPEAVGTRVGSSLVSALGGKKSAVVLNDSIAALLGAAAEHGAGETYIGLIMGTGINICYPEKRENIKKLPVSQQVGEMLISTEVCEFAGFMTGDFDKAVIDASDEPEAAQAEKQCAGGYISKIILEAWRCAAAEGLIEKSPDFGAEMFEISKFVSEEQCRLNSAFGADEDTAREIARLLLLRSAKMGAIMTAHFAQRCNKSFVHIAAEGSFFWLTPDLKENFEKELQLLLAPRGIGFDILKTSDACLYGAALAAFA